MSHQGPILIVSSGDHGELLHALTEAKLLPVIEVGGSHAVDACARLRPAAVIVACGTDYQSLAAAVAARPLYVPLIVIDPADPTLPTNAIPFSSSAGYAALPARLLAALRVQTLHATVLRRLAGEAAAPAALPGDDPLQDATVLLIGRGAGYPALSVALGERLAVVGTLSIEGAAKHLSARDFDGIILADGFSPRVVDAFLTVLSEDARFRNLPVVATLATPSASYDLPNLEFAGGDPARGAARALSLIRQRAFEARLGRTLRALDAGGLIDQHTGLLTPSAFWRDFSRAIQQSQDRGSGLCVARFTLGNRNERVQYDSARIVSRLMRRIDFGTLQDDGSIVVVFADAELRNARMIARRLCSVMRQTSHGPRRDARIDPEVTIADLLPGETASAILDRLHHQPHRAAS